MQSSVHSSSIKDQKIFYPAKDDSVNSLLFTDRGRVFQLKGLKITEATRIFQGQAINNLIDIDQGEKIATVLAIHPQKDSIKYLYMCTKRGNVKKTKFEEYSHIRRNGLIAIMLDKGDVLGWVCPTNGENDLIIITYRGQSIRFKESDIKSSHRDTLGVRGIRLSKDDVVVSSHLIKDSNAEQVLVVMENGWGKKTKISAWSCQMRGGMGVKAAHITSKTGLIVNAQIINKDTNILVISSNRGRLMKIDMKDIPTLERQTQGDRLMRVVDGEQVAAIIATSTKEIEASLKSLTEVKSDIHIRQSRILSDRDIKLVTSKNPKNVNHIYEEELIDFLNLPQRIRTSLRSTGITTVNQLFKSSEHKLRRIRGIGKKSVKMILDLKSEVYEYPKAYIQDKKRVEILNLPIRIENALKKAGILNIDELDESSQKKLLKIKNIGHKALKIIFERKNNVENQAQNEDIPNKKLLSVLLERSGGGRNQEIIQRRYGLVMGEKETLEEIGKSYGLSRERIRQIQQKAFRCMSHPSNASRRPIINLIERLLCNNGCLISDQDADSLVPQIFANQPFDGSSLLDLFADLGWIQSHRIGDMSFYAPKISGFKLIDFMEDIFELLKKSAEPLSPTSILNKLPPIKEIQDDRLNLLNLITKNCSLDPRIETKIAGKFSTYRMTEYVVNLWIPLMIQVLEEARMPLYYTEIADRVNDKVISSNRHLEPRRAHSLLIENSSFAHVGIRGTYGLVKWGLRKESTVELAVECIKKAGFPLHWEQIYNYVGRFKDSPKMNIRSILDQSGKFEKKGEGFYRIKE